MAADGPLSGADAAVAARLEEAGEGGGDEIF